MGLPYQRNTSVLHNGLFGQTHTRIGEHVIINTYRAHHAWHGASVPTLVHILSAVYALAPAVENDQLVGGQCVADLRQKDIVDAIIVGRESVGTPYFAGTQRNLYACGTCAALIIDKHLIGARRGNRDTLRGFVSVPSVGYIGNG